MCFGIYYELGDLHVVQYRHTIYSVILLSMTCDLLVICVNQ